MRMRCESVDPRGAVSDVLFAAAEDGGGLKTSSPAGVVEIRNMDSEFVAANFTPGHDYEVVVSKIVKTETQVEIPKAGAIIPQDPPSGTGLGGGAPPANPPADKSPEDPARAE